MLGMKKKEKITIYSAGASNRSIAVHLREIVNDFPLAHELGFRLFKRNLRALYRQSLLGFGWALLPPLATAALWIFMRGSDMVRTQETGISYPIFVLTGTMLWQIFSEAISAPINQVVQNKAMLSKINIPREGLLLSGVYELLFNVAIKLFLLALVYLFYHQKTSLSSLVFVPLGILSISLAGFSIGLILFPLGMLYQDFNKGLAVLLPFFMYLTPVVFPIPAQGRISVLMKFNPLTNIITQTRNWFTAQPAYDLQMFSVFTLSFVLLFLICLVVYRISMPMIIERMGS
jgi:lipopolysaccharide transport system permease protein